jgi:putative alpha-1,2-mannosidase
VVKLGFSMRGPAQAKANLDVDCGEGTAFSRRRRLTQERWSRLLGKVRVRGGSEQRRTVFATALYHSLIKPCFAPDESPFWDLPGPFVFDIATMWDIYKTQIPLLTAVAPERMVEMLTALLQVAQQEGNLPVGYRMARGADRFFRQGSALAHTAFADVAALDLGGIDWELALLHLHADLRRTYGEDYLENGLAHPVPHTLDLAQGYQCTAQIARRVGDDVLAGQLEMLSEGWRNAFDPQTGLLIDSTFYEGGAWNYSFRIVHDMASRIELAGGDHAFVDMLDKFFGLDAEPVKQPGQSPSKHELAEGLLLNRFEGLNNEPDMEAPYAYHYAGRPDRTAELVHAIIENQFNATRGGLPGNDDSGGLSSWYVWASLGLFPVAGQGIFLVSTPAFEQAELRVGEARFVIETEGFVEPRRGGPAQYIQAALLDDEPLVAPYLTGRELHSGGRLRLVLGPSPSDWATDHRPPSVGSTRSGR